MSGRRGNLACRAAGRSVAGYAIQSRTEQLGHPTAMIVCPSGNVRPIRAIHSCMSPTQERRAVVPAGSRSAEEDPRNACTKPDDGPPPPTPGPAAAPAADRGRDRRPDEARRSRAQREASDVAAWTAALRPRSVRSARPIHVRHQTSDMPNRRIFASVELSDALVFLPSRASFRPNTAATSPPSACRSGDQESTQPPRHFTHRIGRLHHPTGGDHRMSSIRVVEAPPVAPCSRKKYTPDDSLSPASSRASQRT